MKYMTLFSLLIFLVISFFLLNGLQANNQSIIDELDDIDAVHAVALANKLRWINEGVKIYVNSKEIVFKFQDGKIKTIPMPSKKMFVAVAPYIKDTHT